MEIDEILGRLECVRGNGPNYMARCPAHNDKKPSLSIKELDDKILIYCFAGCEAKEIMEAIGLSLKDLYKK